MEDVSGIVGEVSVTVGGKSYLIGNAGWDDWSVFKRHFIEEKRALMLRAVVAIRGTVAEDEYREMRREAINEAGTITDIGERDIRAIMSSREGMGFMLWCMLERRYPQAVTRADCEEAVRSEAVTEDQLLVLTNSMFVAMGMAEDTNTKTDSKGQQGNGSGQAGSGE